MTSEELVSDKLWGAVEPLLPRRCPSRRAAGHAGTTEPYWAASSTLQVTVRCERRADIHEAFLLLACSLVCLRCLLRPRF